MSITEVDREAESPRVVRRRVSPRVVGVVLLAASFAVVVPGFGDVVAHPARLDPVARFLLAVALIVAVCHLFAALVGLVHQPPVVGEIVGGLLLGGSVLGKFWPQARDWLFTPAVLTSLQMAAQLGLVMFMFLLGCELRLSGERSRRSALGWVVLGAVGLPFLGGMGIGSLGAKTLAGSAGPSWLYLVFFGLAVSITALPVLARILTDLRLDRTQLGGLALACAATGDGLTWCALTLALSLGGIGQHGSATTTLGLVFALVVGMFVVVRPALAALVGRISTRGDGDQLLLPVLAAGAMAFAAITQFIGLHPVIGAFLFGAVVPRGVPAVERINHQLQGFAVTILLPLFFAGIGMSVSIDLLGSSPTHWLMFGAVLLTGTVTKFAGTFGGARIAGLPQRDALRLGALMNCRGVTELVVAAIGWQYHLISLLALTILVLVALLTTAMAGPMLRLFPSATVAGRIG